MQLSKSAEIFLSQLQLILAKNPTWSGEHILNQTACEAAKKIGFSLEEKDDSFNCFCDWLLENSSEDGATDISTRDPSIHIKLIRTLFVDYKICRKSLYELINNGLSENFSFSAYDYHASMAMALTQESLQYIIHLIKNFPMEFIREVEINDDWDNLGKIFDAEKNIYAKEIYTYFIELKTLLANLTQNYYKNNDAESKSEPYLTLINRLMLKGDLIKARFLIEPLYNSRYAFNAYIAIEEMVKPNANLEFFNSYSYYIAKYLHENDSKGLAKLARSNPKKFVENMKLDTSGTHWNLVQEALSSQNGYSPSVLDILREEKNTSTSAKAPQRLFPMKGSDNTGGASNPVSLIGNSI
jgi:hypothetical protein